MDKMDKQAKLVPWKRFSWDFKIIILWMNEYYQPPKTSMGIDKNMC
jgi:hypothetical protein